MLGARTFQCQAQRYYRCDSEGWQKDTEGVYCREEAAAPKGVGYGSICGHGLEKEKVVDTVEHGWSAVGWADTRPDDKGAHFSLQR